MSERLKQELAKRLPHLTLQDQLAINAFAEEYDIKVTVKNFNDKHLIFRDESDRKIVVVHAEQREEFLHLPKCGDADIAVITLGEDRTFIGWVNTGKLTDAGDRMIVDIGVLCSMPDSFNFAQQCAHLAKHGGWMDETTNHWICYGCGTKIVFTENVK
jgi:hypothetical protein